MSERDGEIVNPEDTRRAQETWEHALELFGVTLTPTELQFAMALISSVGSLSKSYKAIDAAWALSNMVGRIRPAESPEALSWNQQHGIGDLVQVSPELATTADIDLDASLSETEAFLTRTTSPAFDTGIGSFVLVQNHRYPVPLRLLKASSVSCLEVAARYF